MGSLKDKFFRYLAQTTPQSMAVEIHRAEGVYLYGPNGESYLDLISGFSVNNTGHHHPAIREAIRLQSESYLHTMVYGEYVQAPQVRYAQMLVSQLPESLQQVFFVNSGAEAIEGAMKLAKRHTGRPQLVSFEHAYHGSTHGALSLMGSETYKTAFRPLMPGTRQIPFNHPEAFDQITQQTAAVIVEPIQAEAGVIEPHGDFLNKLAQRCQETGSLLIFDEVQTGFGRTGTLFAFEQFGVVPDILVLAKALGGGLPLGAFIAGERLMRDLSHDPVLGHITTFGGHPLSCAAGMAAFQVILQDNLCENARQQGSYLLENLNHPLIVARRGRGLLLAFELENEAQLSHFFRTCQDFGFLFDLHLFNHTAFRVAPPLTITRDECDELIRRVTNSLDQLARLAI